MANIYNSSAAIINTAQSPNGNFTNLTVQNLIAENAAIDNLNVDQSAIFTGGIETNAIKIDGLHNGDILTSNASGDINGLTIGNTNDVLKVSGGQPTWTNNIVQNQVTTNILQIPGTARGDLLVMTAGSQTARLPIGSSGYFLQSNGTDPSWSPLPDPLIVGGLQVNQNIQLVLFPNRTIITDNSGFVISERDQYTTLGAQSFNNIPTVIYSNATWNITGNAWYKLEINMFTSNTVPFHGIVELTQGATNYQIATFNYDGFNLNTIGLNLILQLNLFTTGIMAIAITAQTTSGTATLSDATIRLCRVPEPIIHV